MWIESSTAHDNIEKPRFHRALAKFRPVEKPKYILPKKYVSY